MLRIISWKRIAAAILGMILTAGHAWGQEAAPDSLMTVFAQIAESGKMEDKPRLLQILKAVVARGDEKSLETGSSLAFFLGEYAMSDSIFKMAANKYPTGGAAKTVAYVTILKEQTSGKQLEAAYPGWVKQFPDTTLRQDLNEDYKRKIALGYAGEKDYPNAARWLARQTDRWKQLELQMELGAMAFDHGNVQQGLKWQGDAIRHLPNKTPQTASRTGYFLQQYANLLFRAGKQPEALRYISEAYTGSEVKSFELKKDYATIAAANGKLSDAMPILEELVKSGRGNRQITGALRQAYIQAHGSEKGFDLFVTNLKSELTDSIKAKAAKQMLNETAPMFTLKDLDGKTVSLQDLKGKVVVLDFWATWCGPCKKSFPAMKLAVEKYRSDKNVVFLFIDCLERIKEPRDAVKKFITDNNYPFTVLLDGQDATVVKQFGVTGIPAKFVIDGNGKIRFRVVGFDGAEDAAVEELSALIELAKKAS